MHLNKNRISELIELMKTKHIAVVGDLMLDEYLVGKVDRISPEAPVPVVNIKSETIRLGGASNVCLNLVSLGLKVTAFGVVGDDKTALELRSLLDKRDVDDAGVIEIQNRITTKKTRIIGENQQIVRIDKEDISDISTSDSKRILEQLEKSIDQIDGIILQDYNKGVITPDLIKQVTELAKATKKPVFVDPKFNNFFNYQNVTVFKPNLRETSIALSQDLNTSADYQQACINLKQRLNSENVLITLSSEGMLLFDKNEEFIQIPTKAVEVADVSGAGDTVIATLAAAFVAGATIKEAVILANDAAGIVVTELGIVPIKPNQLLESIE